MKPPRSTRCLARATGAIVVWAASWIVHAGGVAALAAEQTATAGAELYVGQVKPILKERCYACHAALKQEGGLRLDTGASILNGGDSGPAVEAGEPGASYLLDRVAADDPSERMPPEGQPLTAAQIDAIRAWIAQGAAWPEGELPEADPREHWAFQLPRRPATREMIAGDSGRNPIDLLLDANRRAHGLRPTAPAPRGIQLRRVYLDLIGLPPTLDELEAFCRDERPDAYERAVDRLLESPQYGERWARHWMDIWRYTDWFGLGEQLRNSQKHIWHWRDWITESLNTDLGYAQMVLQMLAGDEIAPTDQATLRATGFLARNYYLFNRTTWLDETLEHTGKAFLGLSINCCKCHDHKYDPLSQNDYYAFRAIFEPHQVRLDVVPGETDLESDGIARAFDAHLDVPTYVHVRGDEKQPNKDLVIEPAVPNFLAHIPFEPQSIALPLAATRPDLQPFFWHDQLQLASDQAREAEQQLAAMQADRISGGEGRDAGVQEMHAQELRLQAALLRVDLMGEMQAAELAKQQGDPSAQAAVHKAALTARRWELADARFRLAQAKRRRRQPDAPSNAEEQLQEAQKLVAECERAVEAPGTDYPLPRASIKALEGPDETESSRFAPYPTQSSGRRLALARWIVHPSNPLTARVAVNHIWLRHFGQPLVDPVDDFGRRTPAPPQQALLDWLTVELVESGWRMKHLHRLIVTSQAYRMAGSDLTTDAAARQTDSENQYYWHRRPMRMQSEVIRDSLLHLAGVLDTHVGGPTVDPQHDEPPYRRSLYFTHSRDDQHPLLAMFDDPDIFRCYRRQESVVPQQALALANSRLALLMSERIARRLDTPSAADPALLSLSGPAQTLADREFIERAFLSLLCRRPEAPELEACQRALDAWRSINDREAAARARANLVHSLLNHNDFVTVR